MSVSQKSATVVRPSQSTLDTRNVNKFRKEIQPSLVAEGHLVLDMSNITFVDSAGLGVLLSTMKQIDSIGGSLCLASLHEEVLTLFRLVRMNRIFEIFGSVEEAVKVQNSES